jgi:cytoskeletal protein CcmA (bactofilin family)
MAKDVGAIIGRDIIVRGEIEGREDLRVEGVVEGTVHLQAELIVGEGGTAKADVHVSTMTVEGTFDGTVACDDVIRLAPGSHTTGTVAAPRVVIDEGAVFTGALEMDVGIDADEAAHG